MTARWTFATPPGPRAPRVVLIAFAHGPRAVAPEDVAAAAPCTVQTVERSADPAWFDAWRGGSLRAIAEGDLGVDLAQLDAADHAHVIRCAPDRPADLGYLQDAWARARAYVARGATLVLDAIAMRYLRGAELPAADAALDVDREVRLVDATGPGGAGVHALHTRGLRKFGAPDLVALCSATDARLVGHAIRELAEQVARGTELATPKHAVHLGTGVTWVAVEDEHRLGELLQLDNAARVLVDEHGHDLTGVVGRLPRARN